MATLTIDCPHCPVTNASFTISAFSQNPLKDEHWNFLAVCPSCRKPIAGVLRARTGTRGHNPSTYGNDVSLANTLWVVTATFPSRPQIDVPDNIPTAVARAFKQAAESSRAGHYDAAAAMYRKAMELGLKDKSPDIDAWKIEKRIDKMADQGLITTDLQDWAHELRLDGNDAVHADEMEKGAADDMHSFCKFLLTYLYTLPEQVKAARARRDGVDE